MDFLKELSNIHCGIEEMEKSGNESLIVYFDAEEFKIFAEIFKVLKQQKYKCKINLDEDFGYCLEIDLKKVHNG